MAIILIVYNRIHKFVFGSEICINAISCVCAVVCSSLISIQREQQVVLDSESVVGSPIERVPDGIGLGYANGSPHPHSRTQTVGSG